MLPKQLVLMLEGQGDEQAVPGLVKRLIDRHQGNDAIFIGETYRIGGIHKIVNKGSEDEFLRYLASIQKKKNLGAVLLLLDGDAKAKNKIRTSRGKRDFCAKEIGQLLAQQAKKSAGAGQTYSFAAVFAVQEFESWILAGCPEFDEPFRGKNIEDAPRDAKGKIKELTGEFYAETTDQKQWASQIEIDQILTRSPKVRSFHRLDHAILELVEAVRTDVHISTPTQYTEVGRDGCLRPQ